MQSTMHVYEVHPRRDRRGVDLISDALPFGRLWYGGPNPVANAIGYAMHYSRSHDAVIRVYDAAGNVIETHEQKGEFREPRPPRAAPRLIQCLSGASFPPLSRAVEQSRYYGHFAKRSRSSVDQDKQVTRRLASHR